jgi:hypothetical protein
MKPLILLAEPLNVLSSINDVVFLGLSQFPESGVGSQRDSDAVVVAVVPSRSGTRRGEWLFISLKGF